MKAFSRIALVTFAVALIATASLASVKVTGKWKGHVSIDMNQIPKNLPDAQRKQIITQLTLIKAVAITLNLKSDNTFTQTATGGPLKKPKTASGTWKLAGNALTLTADKKSQMGATNNSQTLTVSKDGKKMTGGAGGGSVVFTR